MLGEQFEAVLLQSTGASSMRVEEEIQELWSGYGKILRVVLEGAEQPSVVVKWVQLQEAARHPRGWNSNVGHLRKVRSYEVETAWYRDWSGSCGSRCRVPQLLAEDTTEDAVLLVLEDLDAAGFAHRHRSLRWDQVEDCLAWLAYFHATFLGREPTGLWPVGTYWHLATRSEELAALEDASLREAASAIDEKLSQVHFQTFVHGDAKLANFCFGADGAVAAVDFQYVGGGCGMKDVAYFVGSCLDERTSEAREADLLDAYFGSLRQALSELRDDVDFRDVEAEWRELYPVAWADFHRFLKGWSPGHWKINSYSERVTREVVRALP